MLTPGQVYKFEIIKKTDIAYMAKNFFDEEIYFLHFNESEHTDFKPGDEAELYLFIDSKKRPALTVKKPIIQNGEMGFLKVFGRVDDLGVFLDNGVAKHLLLSKDSLGEDREIWPQVGDYVHVKQFFEKRLVAKIVFPIKISEDKFSEMEIVNAHVINIGKDGINLLTPNLVKLFVHKSCIIDKVRLGQEMSVVIRRRNFDGYNCTLKELNKIDIFNLKAKEILAYIQKQPTQTIKNKLTAELVENEFKVSNRRFKEILHYMLEKNLIKIEKGIVKLTGERHG